MSVIKAGTTLTTAYTVEADTTGALEFKTGPSATLAMSISASGVVTFPATTGVDIASANITNLTSGTTSATVLRSASGTITNLLATSLTVNSNNISAENSLGFRNRIINGDMRIDQRNNGTSVTASNSASAVYVLDRWSYRVSAASKISVQRSTTAPAGFQNSLLVTSLSAYSIQTNDTFVIRQPIEGFNAADLGWGASGARSVTLSFWVRSSLTGTFGGAIWNNDDSRFYIYSYSILAANTWEYKTIIVPGDTTGTWQKENLTGIMVGFSVGAGSDLITTPGSWSGTVDLAPTGQVNLTGTNGATWYITGVQFEAGSVATPFERRPITVELQLCQRYFEIFYGGGGAYQIVGVVSVTNASSARSQFLDFLVTKRTDPTITITGNYEILTGGTLTALTSAAPDISTKGIALQVSLNADGTGGQAITLRNSNDVNARMTASAEL